MARHDDEVDQPLIDQDVVRRGSEACLARFSSAVTSCKQCVKEERRWC